MDSDLRKALRLMGFGIALFVLTGVAIGFLRGDSDQIRPISETGTTIIASVLGLGAVGLMAWGGVVAGRSLTSKPLTSGCGTAVTRVAFVLAALLPVIVFALWLVTAVSDGEGPTVSIIGAWLLAVVGTSIAGAIAPEPGRRGLLVLPLLVATAAVVLALSELLQIS